MAHKINVYEDIQGNIEIDHYYKKSELPQLNKFLESLGYQVSELMQHKDSFDRHKPFRDKPCVEKLIVKEVDWFNPRVITMVLDANKDDELLLKDIVKESGKVELDKSNATTMTIITRFRDISKEYEKWKTENHIVETNENRMELHKKFSPLYVEILKKRKMKRLEVGAKVYIQPKDSWGVIKAYDSKFGYKVENEEGYEAYYQRKDIMLKEEKG